MSRPAYWCPPLVTIFFGMLAPYRRLCLHRILVAGPLGLPDDERAVLLCANHTSWWDGFLLREVHRRQGAGRPLYTVMLASQRRRFPWFRWMGALGLEPGQPASLRRVFRFLYQERRRRPYWLAFFPQGRIRPSFARPLDFRPGVRLMVRAVHPGWVIPTAIHLEPLRHPAPTAFVVTGAPIDTARDPSPEALEAATTLLLDRLQGWLIRVGEHAAEKWEEFVAEHTTQNQIRT